MSKEHVTLPKLIILEYPDGHTTAFPMARWPKDSKGIGDMINKAVADHNHTTAIVRDVTNPQDELPITDEMYWKLALSEYKRDGNLPHGDDQRRRRFNAYINKHFIPKQDVLDAIGSREPRKAVVCGCYQGPNSNDRLSVQPTITRNNLRSEILQKLNLQEGEK